MPKFQHTATRRWLQLTDQETASIKMFQHTATRRWLHQDCYMARAMLEVSTHSHPKVAAQVRYKYSALLLRFNTQPPEGGCI